MTQIFGEPGREAGDKAVYKSLETLPDDWIVYAQPVIATSIDSRNPDYVLIHPDLGYIVLEVKDWLYILNCDSKSACIQTRANDVERQEKAPHIQAQEACYIINNKLEQNSILLNHFGKLDFAFRYAGILYHFSPVMLSPIRQAWGENFVLGREDLRSDRIENSLRSIPAPNKHRMTTEQIEVVRALIDPKLILVDKSTGNFKGVLDENQERMGKESLSGSDKKYGVDSTQSSFFSKIEPRLDPGRADVMPNTVSEAISSENVRLIRGFAGTGKTDVLILRAFYLSEHYPKANVLVTTFNKELLDRRLRPELEPIINHIDLRTFSKFCADIYQQRFGRWAEPQATRGLVSHIQETIPNYANIVDKFGVDFLCEEIQWIKELGLTDRENYLGTIRTGRGGKDGKVLRGDAKSLIFDLYQVYEEQLKEMMAFDWHDLYRKALDSVKNKLVNIPKYDAILVDEAQHFAPNWIELLKSLLTENGNLFLCDDPSQSVYRAFSWRQKGVPVVGRTRWLRVPYRCTKQIFQAAYSLIENNAHAAKLLHESGEQVVPDLSNEFIRESTRPEVHYFQAWSDERRFITHIIRKLINQGYTPNDIAILHSDKNILECFSELHNDGIVVDELRRETGMEFKVVFLPKVNDLFKHDAEYSLEEDIGRHQGTFYMAMTRARDLLYIMTEKKWPMELDPILPFVSEVRH